MVLLLCGTSPWPVIVPRCGGCPESQSRRDLLVRGPPPSHPEWPAGVSGSPSILVHRLALAWTIGVVVLVIGAILAVAGFAVWEIGGRTHWYWAAAAVGCRAVVASTLSSAGLLPVESGCEVVDGEVDGDVLDADGGAQLCDDALVDLVGDLVDAVAVADGESEVDDRGAAQDADRGVVVLTPLLTAVLLGRGGQGRLSRPVR